MQRLNNAWVQRVRPSEKAAGPNFLQHYINNDEFKAIVAQGEPALPFLTNKVAIALAHQDSGDGLDIYLAWAIVDIEGWPRSNYYALVPPSLDHRDMARKVFARLSGTTNSLRGL